MCTLSAVIAMYIVINVSVNVSRDKDVLQQCSCPRNCKTQKYDEIMSYAAFSSDFLANFRILSMPVVHTCRLSNVHNIIVGDFFIDGKKLIVIP